MIEYDLYAIPSSGMVQYLKTFTEKTEGIIAFNLLVKDDKMKAVFLDERETLEGGKNSAVNIKKWRKRNANQTKGQSG